MTQRELISVDEARAMIKAGIRLLPPVILPLEKTAGLVLAENQFALHDIPAYDQSSMDGYAIFFEDIAENLPIQGVIAAGTAGQVELLRKHAMRIFTGAPLPLGADTVVMQEKVKLSGDLISIGNGHIEKGNFVRTKGAELKKGDQVLSAGTNLSPARIGLLASIGVPAVSVYPAPVVSIITTGDELQKPGHPLHFGQVYESNTYFLSAALRDAGINDIRIEAVRDELSAVQQKLARALDQTDLVLLTGGISVGDFDFVRRAADLNGVDCQFHKVKQKPGKPFYFGTRGSKTVFGLPGNPASVITCFYEYVLPAIEQMMGSSKPARLMTALLREPFRKVEGLTQFLKGYLENGSVSILAAQESYRLRSFAEANCLVRLDEKRVQYDMGETVEVRIIPG
jgi:molybdopterin molybdotransferase